MRASASGLPCKLKSPSFTCSALQDVQLLLPDYLENLHSLWTSWLSAPRPSPHGDSEAPFNGAPLTAAASDMLSGGQLSIKDYKHKALQLRLAVQQFSRQASAKRDGSLTIRDMSWGKIEANQCSSVALA